MPVEAQIAGGPSWLIAGLGNPGPEYEQTYHNLGFLAIERLGARTNIRISRPECKALVGVGVGAWVAHGWVSPDAVRSWENNRRQPSGPALRLLEIAVNRPEVLVS